MNADRPDDSGTGSVSRAVADSAYGVAVVSITSGDAGEGDEPLATLVESVEAGDHEIAIRERIGGDFDTIQATVSRLADRDDVNAVLTMGGIGVEPGDVTVQAIRQLLDAELPAFETLFTTQSAEAIGADVLTVRPLAGLIEAVPVFCLPHDEQTARLALDEIVCPQLERVIDLASPDEPDPNP